MRKPYRYEFCSMEGWIKKTDFAKRIDAAIDECSTATAFSDMLNQYAIARGWKTRIQPSELSAYRNGICKAKSDKLWLLAYATGRPYQYWAGYVDDNPPNSRDSDNPPPPPPPGGGRMLPGGPIIPAKNKNTRCKQCKKAVSSILRDKRAHATAEIMSVMANYGYDSDSNVAYLLRSIGAKHLRRGWWYM